MPLVKAKRPRSQQESAPQQGLGRRAELLCRGSEAVAAPPETLKLLLCNLSWS